MSPCEAICAEPKFPGRMAKPNIRVAVVDDDSSVRKALDRLLNAAAFDVATYSSGAELLECLETFRPCCIVLDLQMPVLSGFDVQRQLAERSSRAPVIVITGHDSSMARRESLRLGASAFFAKPVDGSDLIAAIEKVAGRPETGG